MTKAKSEPQIPLRGEDGNWRDIASLRIHPDNANLHPRGQLRKLMRSLKTHHWTQPILIDAAGNVVCGHGRLEAAKGLGQTRVPVRCLGEMSEAERRAYIIADNKLAKEAKWSPELLRSELTGLIELGYDVELTGFDTFEIDGILSIGDDAQIEDDVEVPADDAVPVTRPDDVWHIGEHILGVGDARDKHLIKRVLQDGKIQLILVDPPYGCKIENNVSGNGKVKHSNFLVGSGEVSLPEFGRTLLRPAFKTMAAYCVPGALAFVFMDW